MGGTGHRPRVVLTVARVVRHSAASARVVSAINRRVSNRTQQYHQVGNAVPPLLARQIGEIVYGLLDG